jgi:hypothetical protein
LSREPDWIGWTGMMSTLTIGGLPSFATETETEEQVIASAVLFYQTGAYAFHPHIEIIQFVKLERSE